MALPAFAASDASTELAVPRPRYLEHAGWSNVVLLVWAAVLAVGFVAVCGGVLAQGGSPSVMGMILQQACAPALLAVMAAVLLGQGGVDLSVAAVLGLGATVFAALSSRGTPIAVALAAALALGLAIGVVNGLAVGLLRLPGFLVTIPMIGAARGLAWLATDGGQPIRALAELDPQVASAAATGGWVLALVLLAAGVLLFQVRPLRAAAAVPPAPPVRAALVRALPYVASSLVAVAAGVLMVFRTQAATPAYGTGFEQDAIVAAIVGGTWVAGGRASCLGAFFAALLLSALQFSMFMDNVSPYLVMQQKGMLGLGALLLGTLVHWGVASAYAGRRVVGPGPAPQA